MYCLFGLGRKRFHPSAGNWKWKTLRNLLLDRCLLGFTVLRLGVIIIHFIFQTDLQYKQCLLGVLVRIHGIQLILSGPVVFDTENIRVYIL